jgi:hypothetical protein
MTKAFPQLLPHSLGPNNTETRTGWRWHLVLVAPRGPTLYLEVTLMIAGISLPATTGISEKTESLYSCIRVLNVKGSGENDDV